MPTRYDGHDVLKYASSDWFEVVNNMSTTLKDSAKAIHEFMSQLNKEYFEEPIEEVSFDEAMGFKEEYDI